jgi:inner membrane protein
MTLPTHAIFYILISNLLGLPLRVNNIIAGLIGTFVPDISNAYGVGRIIKPVSSYISQKWGHRTITHSWVMILVSFAICSLFKWITDNNIVWFFLLGIFIHIALDMINISGVRFFYPDKMILVMPSEHDVRIGTGSRKERHLAFAFFIVMLLTIPLGLWGYDSTFRFLAGSHTAAVEEYKAYIDKNEVFVEVISGINRISQEPVNDVSFKVVATMPKKLTLVETDTGRRLTIGQVEEAIIETKKMNVKIGVPIKTQFIEIDAGKEGWSRILKELESPYSYAIGEIKLAQEPAYVHGEKDIWEGIEVHKDIVTMDYSGLVAVSKFKNCRVVMGNVKIRKEISEEGILGPLKTTEEFKDNSSAFLVNVSYEGLRIREGRSIKKGDIIAVEPEAQKIYHDIEALRKSLATQDIEEEKAQALEDKSLSVRKEIETLNKTIEVQKVIADKSESIFKEPEQSRLGKLLQDRENLRNEEKEIQRSIAENKDYIIKRKNAIKEETEAKIRSLSAQINSYTKRSPLAGKILSIVQKSANVYEIQIEKDTALNEKQA